MSATANRVEAGPFADTTFHFLDLAHAIVRPRTDNDLALVDEQDPSFVAAVDHVDREDDDPRSARRARLRRICTVTEIRCRSLRLS